MITRLEEPTITKLVDRSFAKEIGGSAITNTVMKQFNDLIEAGTSSSRFTSASAGSSALAGIGSPITKFAGSASAKVAGTNAISAFMTDRFNQGKFLCPFVR